MPKIKEVKSVEDIEMEKVQDEYMSLKDSISKIDVSKIGNLEEAKDLLKTLIKIILR